MASNLFGRLIAANAVDGAGLEFNFLLFAGLNIAGAVFAWATISRAPPKPALMAPEGKTLGALRQHWADPALRAAFAIGFLILFGFIGVFSFVNFVLVRPPFALPMTMLGLVYLVFAPAMASTPFAGIFARRFGARVVIATSLAVAAAGLLLTLSASLGLVLAGLVLVGAATFFAQAAATGFVNLRAVSDKGAASGIYLASYYLGGLVSTPLLGWAFTNFDWTGCVLGAAAAFLAGAVIALSLPTQTQPRQKDNAHAAS